MTSAPRETELEASDGARLHCFRWTGDGPPRAVVQIAHGMGEHAGRYRRLADALTGAGYLVIANDHRGHGRTAGADRLGRFGRTDEGDGWSRVVRDAFEVGQALAEEHPRAPRVLLGHSMGAMLAPQFLYRYGHALDAVVLSGTPGFPHPLELLASRALSLVERWRLGPDAFSPLMRKLLFADANKRFEGDGGATGFEWLSRDTGEVSRYVDDPFCGFVLRTAALSDLFRGAREAARSSNVATIVPLPIYLLSGADDPVHKRWRNIERLVDAYRAAGVNVEVRRYAGGRHEMFNETNRDEVTRELIDWLDRTLPGER